MDQTLQSNFVVLLTAADDIEQVFVATGGKPKQFVVTRGHIVQIFSFNPGLD